MKITPYSLNAKKHPKKQIEQVANSIKEFGMNQPIVVDKFGVIIVGHGRYEACKSLGWSEEEIFKHVKIVDLTEEQAKAYRLADNKLNESDWDMELVLQELKGLSEDMFALTGFDRDLIIEPDEKDDEVPEIPEEPQSKIGDLYELGNHRVLCGDSTKIEDVERLMDGKKADMVFTDPPYGMKLNADYSGMKGWHQGKKYNNVIGDHADFNNDFINNIFSIFKDTKEKFLWGADYYVDLLPDFGKTGAWIVWDKRVDESKDKMYGSGFEMLWSQEKHQRRLLRGQWAGFMGDAEARNRMHPTQKPTKILMEIMQEYCSSGEVVADLFLGSGSTLIASEKTGRICYGMELDPKYVDVIVQRYVDYTGNNKIKKNGIDIIWKTK